MGAAVGQTQRRILNRPLGLRSRSLVLPRHRLPLILREAVSLRAGLAVLQRVRENQLR
jgi:hypothetical protein